MVAIPEAKYNTWGEEIQEREDTPEEARVRKLLPVLDVQTVTPRVCATCHYGRIRNGAFECLREGGYHHDVGDMLHWYHACKFYRKES